jgi:HSP20 family molecular chaperone IbpA
MSRSRRWELDAAWPFPSAADVERRFDEWIRSRWGASAEVVPADVFVYEEELWIELDLPGVQEEQVHVRIEGGALWVEAVRSSAPPAEGARATRLERPRGPIRQRVPLPGPLPAATLEYRLEGGVLRVRVRTGAPR